MEHTKIDLVGRTNVRRNLFGTLPTDSRASVPERIFSEEKQKEFFDKWGVDVRNDSIDPNSRWEWELVEFEDLPDAFKRMGGCRPRRYSGTSVGSGGDVCQSRSGSFSMPSVSDEGRARGPRSEGVLVEKLTHLSNVNLDPVRGCSSLSSSASSRTLITDYLRSQAKRSRRSKDTMASSPHGSPELVRHWRWTGRNRGLNEFRSEKMLPNFR